MDDPQSDQGGSGQNESANKSAAGIVYRKLRSPSRHGQRLDLPPLQTVDEIWQENLKVQSANCDEQIADIRLTEFQKQARSEVIALAAKYSGAYLESNSTNDAYTKNVVMAGHQPELFHPGVWFKNFVLSNLGQRFSCTAINLIVDNDICGSTSIRHPKIDTNGQPLVSLGSIPVDASGPNEPFEGQLIQDWSLFESFGTRATDAINQQVKVPIINRLWPNVIAAAHQLSDDQHQRFGHAIAAGRHRLEHEIGLRTLEVPISWVSATQSFATFAGAILNRAKRFRDCYNQTLLDYRKVHKIRSTSHPVPELESRDDWIEAPFWVWKKSDPIRRRLFSRQVAQGIELSDLAGWETKLNQSNFTDQFVSLSGQDIAIRPKALMTTMFSRLLLSDLFLHGIGGAKYDQLTDVIAQRFFSVKLPQYLTLSATMKLPTDFELTRPFDVVGFKQRIRQLKFHPETLISNPSLEATELINQKLIWTVGERKSERSREKHLAIETLNRKLAQFADVTGSDLMAQREKTQSKIRESQILESREL